MSSITQAADALATLHARAVASIKDTAGRIDAAASSPDLADAVAALQAAADGLRAAVGLALAECGGILGGTAAGIEADLAAAFAPPPAVAPAPAEATPSDVKATLAAYVHHSDAGGTLRSHPLPAPAVEPARPAPECPECKGEGTMGFDEPCDECNGAGRVPVVPAAVAARMSPPLPEMGHDKGTADAVNAIDGIGLLSAEDVAAYGGPVAMAPPSSNGRHPKRTRKAK